MSLAQGNSTPTRPRIEPGSPDPESDALTTRPVRPPPPPLQFLLGKNVHASDNDRVVETFFIDFNIIRIMSEVMVDYVSVSLFC